MRGPIERPGYWSQVGRDLRRPRSFAPPLVALVGLGVLVEPGWGVSAALLLTALVIYDVLMNARGRARDTFFGEYARSRGLEPLDEVHLPELTPLLASGEARYAGRVMSGVLPGGMPGVLAHYTYAQNLSEDDGGTVRAERVPFTVVLSGIDDVSAHVGALCCEPRSGAHFRDEARARGRAMRRLELESVQADRRYEIFFDPGADELWLRRLHSPSFIVWLAESAPRSFGFELCGESLCAYRRGHLHSAAELDALCEAAGVVSARVADEVGAVAT